MAEPLTPDRFRALAAAYGSRLARWPEADRAAAAAMAKDPTCRAILLDAAVLDQALDLWAAPDVPPAVVDRVIRSAPAGGRSASARGRLFWPAVGIATAVAGMAAGSIAMAGLTPPDVPGDVGTVFGDIAGSGS